MNAAPHAATSAAVDTTEITFYEELGVAANASQEQIRDAFRSLVRLLHPDQQTDPQLKTMAEAQMRKLNRIYTVLSDPDRRRRYNDSLEDGFGPSILINNDPSVNFRKALARLSWVGAALVIVGLLAWLSFEDRNTAEAYGRGGPLTRTSATRSTTQRQAASEPASTVPAALPRTGGGAGHVPEGLGEMTAEILKLRSDLRTAVGERDAALRELARLREPAGGGTGGGLAPAERPVTLAPLGGTMTELPTAGRLALPTFSPGKAETGASRTVARSRFAGFWFYAKPPLGQRNKNRALYPPEFIETSIAEENGVVQGKYRSRFQIVDRAISPDVNFEFTGALSGPGVTGTWMGPGGARGELTLRLNPDNTLRVDWSTSELGSQQGLISGTATLTRRVE